MTISKVGTVKTGLLAVLLVAAGAYNALAQSSEYPFEGEVTGTDVYVRSAPNLASYAVSKISKPARITVTGKVAEGWYAIRPVQGCYGVIDQSFVKVAAADAARPARKEGVISGDNVRIRAAGTLRQNNFESLLMTANKGDKVVIVGMVEADGTSWYIILPPDKARFFISSQYVEKVGEGTPVEETAPESEYEEPTPATEPATTQPADSAAPAGPAVTEEAPAAKVEVKLPETGSVTPVTSAATPSVKPVVKKPEPGVRTEADMLHQIRQLERAMIEEGSKPMDKRDMNKLLAQAKAINVPEGSRFKSVYDSMVDYINGEIKLAAETRRTQELVAKTLEDVNAPAKPLPAKPLGPMENVIVGKIQPSRVFDRYDSAIGQIYIIRNVDTGEILTFARPADSTVDVNAYVGQVVKVSGKKDFDRKAGVQIIKINNISPASPEDAVAKVAAPETPVEAPAEQPAPKTEPTEPAVAKTEEPVKQITPEDIGMESGVKKPSIEDLDLPAKSTKPAPEQEPIAVTPIEPTVGTTESAAKPELPAAEPIPAPPVSEEPTVTEKTEPTTPVAPISVPEPIESTNEGPAPVEITKIKPIAPPAEVTEPETTAVETPTIPEVPGPEVKPAVPPVATEAGPKVAAIEPPSVPSMPEEKTTESPAIPPVPEVNPAVPPVATEAGPKVTAIEPPTIPTEEKVTPPVAVPAEPEVATVEKPAVPDVKPIETPEIATIDDADLPSAPAVKSIAAPTEAAESGPDEATAVKPISVPSVEEPPAAAEEPSVAAISTPEKPVVEKDRRPRAITAVEVPTADTPIKATSSSVETSYETEWD